MKVLCEAKAQDRHEYDISCILYHAPYVYTASDDGKIKMWNEDDLALKGETLAVDQIGYSVYYMSLNPRAGLLYSCGNDGKVRAWNLQDLSPASEQPQVPVDPDRELWRVHCDQQFGRVYTLDDQGLVKVYDINGWRCLVEISGLEQLKDVTAVGDCVFTVRDLDVTCWDLTAAANGTLRSSTAATLLGRSPLHLYSAESPSLAFVTRDGRSISIHAVDKQRRFKKLCEITGASDKLINAVCIGPGNVNRLYSGGWDNKLSVWYISGSTGKAVDSPLDVPHLINVLAVSSTAVFAGGPSGALTKISLS